MKLTPTSNERSKADAAKNARAAKAAANAAQAVPALRTATAENCEITAQVAERMLTVEKELAELRAIVAALTRK